MTWLFALSDRTTIGCEWGRSNSPSLGIRAVETGVK
jgi:hypothetical protein